MSDFKYAISKRRGGLCRDGSSSDVPTTTTTQLREQEQKPDPDLENLMDKIDVFMAKARRDLDDPDALDIFDESIANIGLEPTLEVPAAIIQAPEPTRDPMAMWTHYKILQPTENGKYATEVYLSVAWGQGLNQVDRHVVTAVRKHALGVSVDVPRDGLLLTLDLETGIHTQATEQPPKRRHKGKR